jgi:hypothetical protein
MPIQPVRSRVLTIELVQKSRMMTVIPCVLTPALGITLDPVMTIHDVTIHNTRCPRIKENFSSSLPIHSIPS